MKHTNQSRGIKSNSYSKSKNTNDFDKIVADESEYISNQNNSIIYNNPSKIVNIIKLKKNRNEFHNIIFRTTFTGFKSNWFNELNETSKSTYFGAVSKFFKWINETGYQTKSKFRYNILKDYESYLLNDKGNKRSTLVFINSVLQNGSTDPSLTEKEFNYIQTLLSVSSPSKPPPTEPSTLSNWFNLPWLRSIIGERQYLQLESPRILFLSFRFTISITLLWLLKHRKRWQKSPKITFNPTYFGWQYDWNRKLIENVGDFNDQGEPMDGFSELLWIDLVKPSEQKPLRDRITELGSSSFPQRFSRSGRYPWQMPILFHPDNQSQYSYLEELLCSWLIACEAVQPTDIPKLKKTNYATERNRFGRLLSMECTYYKGRSGTSKQPAILMGSDPWTKALDNYIAGLSTPNLFNTRIDKCMHLPTFNGKHSPISFLFKIWGSNDFQSYYSLESQRSNSSSLFLNALLSLKHGDENPNRFLRKKGKCIREYREKHTRPIPSRIFTLTHIKTTAIQSGSDSYRESDLINHHSHSSLTEKTSYLTDENKEWINQTGRITRLVLYDLLNVVFKPSIAAIRQEVKNKELRTVISEDSHDNSLSRSLSGGELGNESDELIIVTDTIDTALYFIHYITEARLLFPKLLRVRPDWVERTLIVQVEWMTRTLSRMRSSASAHKEYTKYSSHFPPLFEHLLETTE